MQILVSRRCFLLEMKYFVKLGINDPLDRHKVRFSIFRRDYNIIEKGIQYIYVYFEVTTMVKL